jgi:hypothetical protein
MLYEELISLDANVNIKALKSEAFATRDNQDEVNKVLNRFNQCKTKFDLMEDNYENKINKINKFVDFSFDYCAKSLCKNGSSEESIALCLEDCHRKKLLNSRVGNEIINDEYSKYIHKLQSI